MKSAEISPATRYAWSARSLRALLPPTVHLCTPRTSAAPLSQSWEMSLMPPVPPTVLGPPWACTPVYWSVSSWNLTASACVPAKTGPPTLRIDASREAMSSPRFAAHSVRAAANYWKVILRAVLSLFLAKIRSMSVFVHFLLMTLQSLAILAKVFPSISGPLAYLAKTSCRLLAPPPSEVAAAAPPPAAAFFFFFAGAFFSSSS